MSFSPHLTDNLAFVNGNVLADTSTGFWMTYHGVDLHYQNSIAKPVERHTILLFSLIAPFVLIYYGLQKPYLKPSVSISLTVDFGMIPMQISLSGPMPIYPTHLLSHTTMKASFTESTPKHPTLRRLTYSSWNYLQSTTLHLTSPIPHTPFNLYR